MRKTYAVILSGLFIAMQAVLGKMLAVDLTFVRITFKFVPVALGGIIFGPIWNGLIGAAADIAGFFLFPGPSPGPYFPGFTINAFLAGYAYGFFMNIKMPFKNPSRERNLSNMSELIIRTLLAAFCVTMIVDALIGTLWVSILFNMPYAYYFIPRFIKSAIMLPVHATVIVLIWKPLGKFIESTICVKLERNLKSAAKEKYE